MFKDGDKVKIKNPNVEAQGDLLAPEAINILKAVDFTGTVTKLEDDLIFVGFIHEELGWVTQVFKEDEIEGIE